MRNEGPISASCEDGIIYVFDLSSDGLTELHKFNDNKYTSWCTFVDIQRNALFSGADEGYFTMHDLTTFDKIGKFKQ